MPAILTFLLFFSLIQTSIEAKVTPGVENLFKPPYQSILRGKKIALITNQTGIDSKGNTTIDLLREHAEEGKYCLRALLSPEHGIWGMQHAEENIEDQKDSSGIVVHSLYGKTRRPTAEMLKDISLLIFDIQDIGSRSYTYISTLFYAMEEAAKANIPVVVLDRPNPMGGEIVDGPMMEEKWRSFVGYINVPYCHGMTVGELTQFFNVEYKVGCDLVVIPMTGWRRDMTFEETKLPWIPTSPQIPESQTSLYYPTTGILGELQIFNIGVGYTLPFKVVGAPWIDADRLAAKLNAQQFPGVRFQPFHYTPFFGRYSGEPCHGVLIIITDCKSYLPVTTQFLIIGILKNLYPSEFQKGLEASKSREEMFNKVNGTDKVLQILKEEQYIIWKLRALHQHERKLFLEKRKKYLNPEYKN